MTFNSIIDKIDVIDTDKNYWFVRTDSGEYYQNYLEGGFIAIGWNYITIQDLKELDGTEHKVRNKIALMENLDIVNSSKDKGKVTTILNKLRAFRNLNVGDIIIIPNENSQRLAFGFVEDNQIFTNVKDIDCSFVKRKKIKWVEEKDINELDKIFYQIRISRHTISSVKIHEAYIDRVIKTLFFKNNYSHYVFDLQTNEDINFKVLLQLINNIQTLTEKLNTHFQLGENLDDSSIKLNLQSRGKIEFKFLNGKSLILLAILLGPMNLNKGTSNINSSDLQKLEDFKKIHKTEIQETQNALQKLEVDRDKINSIY